MLYAGSDDGLYRVPGVGSDTDGSAERVFAAERVFRLRQFAGLEGLFAATEGGLYHTTDGEDWTAVPHPRERVFAVAADPAGEQLYTGTKPAEVYAADLDGSGPSRASDWTERPGLRELGDRLDWGLERHDGLAQVRSLCVHPAAPDRLAAGVEVGGVHVSEDAGQTWTTRRIEGFEAPHTDDIHHLAMPAADTLVAATGSGLFHSADAGRSWERLDRGHPQRYFRESLAHDGRLYAGAAPGSSTSWEQDPNHALFEAPLGEPLERVDSPVPDEHPIGWSVVAGSPVTATHQGTLLSPGTDGWRTVGAVPTPGRVRGRYLPLTWFED